MPALQCDLLLNGMRDYSGAPLSAGRVYTYAAGTTTAKATYYDSGELNQATNPIVLNAYGMAQIYADGVYKFVIADSSDTVLYTFDNLTYITVTSSSWTVVPAAITYVSATQFYITGDYSADFPANIAIQVTIATGPITGWVVSSDYNVTAAGKTTVNVTWSTATVMTSAVNGTQASVGPSPATLPPAEAVGVIKPFGGASAPAGYLLCDGTAYLRAVYPGLFAVIGTTWGTGSGGTQFNVPDLRGRTLVGAGTGTGLSTRTLGQQTYGAETHQLAANEMPYHNHTASSVVTESPHTHTANSFVGFTGSGTFGPSFVGSPYSYGAISTDAAATGLSVATSIGYAGGTNAVSLMNPFAVVNYVIKT